MRDRVTVLAPAKLNLALDVVGILPGGYHALDMTMQAISLYERVVIRRSLEQNPLCGIIILNAGIVTGRNAPAADITGTAQQRIKLDVFVAVNARIRRQAALIAGNKPVNDLFMKNIAHIKDIMINTQTRAHAACVRDVIGRAARTRLFADIALIIQRHRHARHVIALLQQQHCTRRAVHAAAHGCENLFLHSMVLSSKRTAPLP